MALEIPLFLPGLFEASADVSTKQYYCFKMSTTNRRVALCDTDGEIILGVLQNKPSAAGASAEMMVAGITKVVAAETLTAGDYWGTDNAGKARKVEHTLTGADTGDFIAGFVVEGAAASELATVTIGFASTYVETQ